MSEIQRRKVYAKEFKKETFLSVLEQGDCMFKNKKDILAAKLKLDNL